MRKHVTRATSLSHGGKRKLLFTNSQSLVVTKHSVGVFHDKKDAQIWVNCEKCLKDQHTSDCSE